jgi:hypothetical protein
MSENEDNTPVGADGATRKRGRDCAERRLIRAVRAGWCVPESELENVRNTVVGLVHDAMDDRTKVMAAKLLLEAEIAHVNSVNLLTNEDTEAEASEDESADPETFD